MRVRWYDSARAFLDRAGSWLEAAEAENNLMLGVLFDLVAAPDRWGEPALLAVVEDAGEIRTVATRTPPWNLIVARAPESAIDALVDSLLQRGESLPGVIGPAASAARFATRWSAQTGLAVRETMSMRAFELRRVVPPRPVAGALRRARRDELPLLAAWAHDFHRDAGVHAPVSPDAIARQALQDGRAHFWDDRGPVSLAVYSRETPNGVGITMVFTPAARRGRGYASAAVAALSQQLLDGGRRLCFLFTDLANPTSNHIYQAIGYQPVADYGTYSFGTGTGDGASGRATS